MDDFDSLDESSSGINVTPLVDVSLVLVLIFLVTSPFFAKTLIPVVLPQAVSSATESQENITISISPEGYALNEIPLKKPALETEMRRAVNETGIRFLLIRADERIPHGDIEDIMKIGRAVGMKRIAFATVPKI
jgi:biopolymer transport protein ExbD